MGCGAQHTGCGGFEIGFESAVDCTDYADGQTANRIAVRKCRKRVPGTRPAAAGLQIQLLPRKSRCEPAIRFSAQQSPLLSSRLISPAATAFFIVREGG